MTLKRTSRVRPPQGDEGCCHRPQAICPAEATSSLTDRALSSDLPTLPSSSSSMSHLSCGGLVLVVIWWGGLVVPSPHHCCCCHRLWAICPAEASSPSLSSGGLVVVIHGSFVLQRPRPHHCHCRSSPHHHRPVGASSTLPVLADCPCCVIIVVVVR